MLTERQENVLDLIDENRLLEAHKYGLESATDYVKRQVEDFNWELMLDVLDSENTLEQLEETEVLLIKDDSGEPLENNRRELMDDTYAIIRHLQTA